MASSHQSPGGQPTMKSRPINMSICYECDAEVEDMKIHKQRCHPEKYWCEVCQTNVLTKRECEHNERHHARLLGLMEPPGQRQPVQKINFTQELKKMKGTRDDWVIVPKSKFEVLWDKDHNTALLALEDLTAADLEVKYNSRNHEWYQETGIPGVRCVDKTSYGELDPPMDTGHLAARANYRLSQQDTIDTFSLINGIPQQSAVNRGKVKRLENHYRERLVPKWDGVIQATGPIYDLKKTKPQPSQNGLEVFVPTGFFKLMKMRRKDEEPKVQAFQLDHSNVDYQSVLGMRSTVEEIADLTQLNLDLFANCKYTWDAGEESSICMKCLKTFRNKEELDKHSEIHVHHCGYCRRDFNSKAEREAHMEIHFNYPCDDCHKVYRSQYDLSAHMEVHAGERNYTCSQCSSRFNTQTLLNEHVKVVHEVEWVVCPMVDCGKKINKVLLKEHLSNVHCDEQFICDSEDWCKKTTKTKQLMIKHITKTHDFLPKVECPEAGCSRVFANMRTFCIHRTKDHGRTDKFPTSKNKTVAIDPEVGEKLKAERRTARNRRSGYLTMEEWNAKSSTTSAPPTASATVTSGALEELEDQEESGASGSSPHHELFCFSDDFEEVDQSTDSITSGLTESQAAGIASIVDTFDKYSLASQQSTPPAPSSSSHQMSKPASEPPIVDITGDDDEEPTPVVVKVNRTAGATSVSGWVVLPPNKTIKRKSTDTPASTKPTNKRKKKDDPAQRTLDSFFKH